MTTDLDDYQEIVDGPSHDFSVLGYFAGLVVVFLVGWVLGYFSQPMLSCDSAKADARLEAVLMVGRHIENISDFQAGPLIVSGSHVMLSNLRVLTIGQNISGIQISEGADRVIIDRILFEEIDCETGRTTNQNVWRSEKR